MVGKDIPGTIYNHIFFAGSLWIELALDCVTFDGFNALTLHVFLPNAYPTRLINSGSQTPITY